MATEHDPQPQDPPRDGATPASSGDAGTTPVGSGDADPTPTSSGDAGDDQDARTTDPDAEQRRQEAAFKKRLERERKKWEAERQEIERKAKMDEAERLKADMEDLQKRADQAEQAVIRERALRSLAGRVVDPEDAYTIAERADLVDDEGAVDVDALLKAKPYLAKPDGTPRAGSTPSPRAAGSRDQRAADLRDQISKARTRQDRIRLQRELAEVMKG